MWKEAIVYVVAFIVALLAVWLLPLGFSRAGGAAVVAAAFLAAGLAQLAESVIPLWQIVLLVGLLLLAGSYLLDRWFGPLLYRSVETEEAGERRKGRWKGSGDRTAAGDRDGTMVQNATENLVDSAWPAAFGQNGASREFQGADSGGEALRSHVQETGNTASGASPAESEAASGEAERAPKSSEERWEEQTAFLLRSMDGIEEAASDPGADQTEPEELLSLDSADAEQKMRSVDRDDAEQEEFFPLDSDRVELEKLSALDLDGVEPAAMTGDGGGPNVEPARRLRDWLDELPVSMTPDIEAAVLQAGAAADGRGLLQALDLSHEEEDGQLSAFMSSSSSGVSAVENGLPSGQAMPREGALLEEAMPGIVDRSLLETDEAAEPPCQEDAMKAGPDRQEGQRAEHGWSEGEQSTERREPEEDGQTESWREEESERPARMIGPEVVQAVALELRLNRRRLGAADYERCIRRCLDAPLSDRDYYVLARLLMEHYVVEQQYGKLAAWLEELADRFRAYPAVAEELALWRQFAATLANSWGEKDES
ncbi:hypothetical protein RA955_02400 [Geobacillus proteiniphilus]|uniref:Uncharacterized protein n=1 Tax=Geobacillus proteiniphilus TaxID=860353 RepID=A0ABY9MH68_9BACL|nr:hypothetical protein [Geobacillus proteiniphilus]WMJ16994.1 hypothetical protein RA955_02400 [Geobacillus proteiniphilus]